MSEFLFPTYTNMPTVFTKGKGATIYDEKNKKYIDFCAGLSVNSMGYGNKKIIKSLQKFATKIWHTSNTILSQNAVMLAKRLTEATFADSVFFTNSGAEAIECAIKSIKSFQYAIGNQEKKEIISFYGGFHGRTMGALSACCPKQHKPQYTPVLPDFHHAHINDKESVLSLLNNKTGGIIIEPIQGHGGIVCADKDFLKFLRNTCDEHGIILCFDEIQCGSSRTGKFLASEHYDVSPDIATLAKGIGSGLPIGACIATRKISDCMTLGTHGTTYGGNPLMTATSNVILEELLKEKMLYDITKKGNYLKQKLDQLCKQTPKIIKKVKGIGLLLGIEIHETYNYKELIKKFFQNGLLVSAAQQSTIRITPPLVISNKEIDEGINTIQLTLSSADFV